MHCRVRPMLADLDSDGEPELLGIPGTPSEEVVMAQDDENVSVLPTIKDGTATKAKMFEFERVYSHTDSQNQVFEDVSPLLTSLLDGLSSFRRLHLLVTLSFRRVRV